MFQGKGIFEKYAMNISFVLLIKRERRIKK